MTAGSIDTLPPLRDVIAEHGLGAKKGFGQHFLLDLNITRKIVRAAGVGEGDVVIEVGPGPGGLTRALLETGARIVAIERDPRCLPLLADLAAAAQGRLHVVSADALKTDENEALSGAGWTAPARIVSNLPYNVGTELLVKWLTAREPVWSTMTLMFQKEVADRIVASPGLKAYGRLSVLAALFSKPGKNFDLPARAFTPPPKVESAVVSFRRIEARPDPRALSRVTQAGFGGRRKMLRSSLRPLFGARTEAVLAAAGVSPTDRAEAVPPHGWARLCECLKETDDPADGRS